MGSAKNGRRRNTGCGSSVARPWPITWADLDRQVRRIIAQTELRGSVKVIPWTAKEERDAAARDHAYVYPSDLDFHFSSKILALPKAHRDAIVAHEIGHCLAQYYWNSSTEDEADEAARQSLGTEICYDSTWPGKGLQYECCGVATRAVNPSKKAMTVKPSDLDDAIEHAQESLDIEIDRDGVQVSDVTPVAIADLYSYDDIDSWSEWRHGELASMDPEERSAELKSFRGAAFAKRATAWINDGRVPPIVLLDLEEGAAVGDGRGRTSVALGMGWPTVDAVIVTRRQSNPSSVRRGTPPRSLSDYLKASEIHAKYRAHYFKGDTKLASSRTTQAPDSIPLGTWRYDDGWKGVYGHEIDELVAIDPQELEPTEYAWDRVRDDLRRSGKLEDAERYAEWLKDGNEMPPVTVVQTDNGTLRLSDGHRRAYAALLAKKPVRAWVSWNAPHPKGMIDSNGTPMKVGLTYEIATGKVGNPRSRRIAKRIAS